MAENIFESVTKKYRGSPTMVVLFIAAFAMFAVGANHFVEDTVSSKIGLETLQNAYGLKVQIFNWTYWSMSIAPQIGSIIFFYMYLSDRDEKKYLWLSIACQVADFFADSWYRSNGRLLDDPKVFIISSVLTFVYFSVGSEVFLTIGSGLMLKIAAPALQTWKSAWLDISKASKGSYSPSNNGGGDKGKGGGGFRPQDGKASKVSPFFQMGQAEHRPTGPSGNNGHNKPVMAGAPKGMGREELMRKYGPTHHQTSQQRGDEDDE